MHSLMLRSSLPRGWILTNALLLLPKRTQLIVIVVAEPDVTKRPRLAAVVLVHDE